MGSITNDGQICLNNQVYEQTTQIKGSGCFTAKGIPLFILPMLY